MNKVIISCREWWWSIPWCKDGIMDRAMHEPWNSWWTWDSIRRKRTVRNVVPHSLPKQRSTTLPTIFLFFFIITYVRHCRLSPYFKATLKVAILKHLSSSSTSSLSLQLELRPWSLKDEVGNEKEENKISQKWRRRRSHCLVNKLQKQEPRGVRLSLYVEEEELRVKT